jgi:hypothetical protein
LPLSVVTADKGYDSSTEDNHLLVREDFLHAFSSAIPARYEDVPIWRTHSGYRKHEARLPNCCTINETRMKP